MAAAVRPMPIPQTIVVIAAAIASNRRQQRRRRPPIQATNATMPIEIVLIIPKVRHPNESTIPKIGKRSIMHLDGE